MGVGQEVGVIDSVADLRIAAVGNGKRGRKIPVGHHIFRNNTWVREPSAPQPTCWLKATPCPKDHEDFGHGVSDKGALHHVNESVVSEFSCKGKHGNQISTRQLCYVSDKLNRVYLS